MGCPVFASRESREEGRVCDLSKSSNRLFFFENVLVGNGQNSLWILFGCCFEALNLFPDCALEGQLLEISGEEDPK
jgi:hypothetical protein